MPHYVMLHGAVSARLLCCLHAGVLLLQLEHHVRHFNILFALVFDCHFEDDVFLVCGDGFPADRFDELA